MKFLKSTKNSKGFSLIEILGALSVSGVLMVALSTLDVGKSDNIKNENTAQFHSMVTTAASLYVKDNYAAVVAGATPTVPHKITLANLIPNYIPSTFSVTAKNAYGQSVCVLVLEPTANELVGVVVTEGGTEIPAKNLSYIAQQIGPSGGYVDATTPLTANGAQGAWSLALANYATNNCSGTPVSKGHLASALFFDNNTSLQNFAYRSNTGANKESNKFTTPITLQPSMAMMAGASCAPYEQGSLSTNTAGELMTCKSGVWAIENAIPALIVSDPNAKWGDPAVNRGGLGVCDASNDGQVRSFHQHGDGRYIPSMCRNGLGWSFLFFENNGFKGYVENRSLSLETRNLGIYGSGELSLYGVQAGATCASASLGSIELRNSGLRMCQKDPARGTLNYVSGAGQKGWADTVDSYAQLLTINTDPFGTVRPIKDSPAFYFWNGSSWEDLNYDSMQVNGAGNARNIATNTCSGNDCVATATCSAPYPTVIDGFCSGSSKGVGVVSSTTGWSCTARDTSVMATAYCK